MSGPPRPTYASFLDKQKMPLAILMMTDRDFSLTTAYACRGGDVFEGARSMALQERGILRIDGAYPRPPALKRGFGAFERPMLNANSR